MLKVDVGNPMIIARACDRDEFRDPAQRAVDVGAGGWRSARRALPD